MGAVALFGLARWLVRRKREDKPVLLDPGLFGSPHFRMGVTQQMLQQITLGGAMIVIPIFLQIALEYNALEAGLSIAPLSLSMFVIALVAGRRAGRRRPAVIVRVGFALALVGMLLVIPVVPRAGSGWALVVPLLIAGSGLGLLVSQLNNYTLAPVEEQRASEAAGVNSAGGNFGLSFGLAVAGGVMLATLSVSFTGLTDSSGVIPEAQKETISAALEDDAEVVSDSQLQAVLAGEPPEVQTEILSINDEARALSLQVAMLVPVLACSARTGQLVPHDATAGHRASLAEGGARPCLTSGTAGRRRRDRPPCRPSRGRHRIEPLREAAPTKEWAMPGAER